MILGIGVDTAHTPRFSHWLGNPSLMERFFRPQEITYALNRGPSGAASLAARFAAKEAFGKALGTGMKGIRLKDVWVQTDDLGKPSLHFDGSAARALVEISARKVHLSLSHDGGIAVAFVIIEGEG